MPKAIVEMPKGTKYKYEMNKDSLVLTLDRVLKVSVPYNYGYITNTMAEDGDPLDVFIISEEPIPPLTEVEIDIVGGFDCLDNGVRDEKLVAFISGDYAPPFEHYFFENILKYLETYKPGFEVVRQMSAIKSLDIMFKNTLGTNPILP